MNRDHMIGPDPWLGQRAPHRNHGCRIRDFIWRGRRCLSMENEIVRVVICADKGCDILELTHKPTDTELLHQAPAGLSAPPDAAMTALPAGPFRDMFPGGWYLMLPNGPGPCSHDGAEHGHHGEATFLSWEVRIDEDEVQRCAISFFTRLRRTPLTVRRRIVLERGSGRVRLREAVTSEAGRPIDVLWGHHPTFGGPWLDENMRIDLPPCRGRTGTSPAGSLLGSEAEGDWPNMPGVRGGMIDLSCIPPEDARTHDFVRYEGFTDGWFAIRNETIGVGMALRWDEALFPVLGYWRMLGGGPGYPWYQARRMIALEPAVDLPSVAEASARGSALTLSPGQTVETVMEATVFTPSGRVVDVAWGGAITAVNPVAPHAA